MSSGDVQPADRLRRVAARLEEAAHAIESGAVKLQRSDLDLLKAEITHAQIDSFGPRPRARRGEGARRMILAYFKSKHAQTPVYGDEIADASGIHEWARRVRELRVEDGYDIEHLEASTYLLHSFEPDEDRARSWRIANRIRRSGGSATSRIEEFLRHNVGVVVRRDQVDYVAKNVREGTRRLRELRDEQGWPILSHIDDPHLRPSEYLLISLDPADFRDPNQRDYPEKTRQTVFERDAYRCERCDRTREDALRAGDTRFFLEVHHRVGIAEESRLTDAEKADPQNLATLCHRCHTRRTADFQRRRRQERRAD